MRILFATSGPVPAQENADYVVNITKRLGAELTVLHVVNDLLLTKHQEWIFYLHES